MSKFSALVIIIALRIIYHPAPASGTSAAFIKPSVFTLSAPSITEDKVTSINANINYDKIYLNKKYTVMKKTMEKEFLRVKKLLEKMFASHNRQAIPQLVLQPVRKRNS